MAADHTPKGLNSAPDAASIERERGYLMRFALLQLRNQTAAEDAVQETLLAAIEGHSSFSGKSSVRTWLTGILKHKIIDQLRRQMREDSLSQGADDTDRSEADVVDALFAADGHWNSAPANWGDPDRNFENAQFWKVFEICCGLIPARTARVFIMREVMELTTTEICKELGITPTNCWVMLHRARLTLRACLEQKWFGAS